MNQKRIALVTGANRGIGFEICRQLAKSGLTVILTARDESAGLRSVETLQNEAVDVHFEVLDVQDEQSIRNLRENIETKWGRLDILINNAAILLDESYSTLQIPLDVMRRTLETNLLGPLYLCQTFMPLMKKNNYGRIINISSGMGAFSEMGSGYPAYRVSKTALNAMTKILAAEVYGSNILINAMCPGWVRTKMGGAGATRSVEKGAETAVWLALMGDGGPNGRFFRDRREIGW
jgi:NAD(P)-dependent dehydrogenase (short-subunit alcohol dehydrogenase family)